MGYLSGIAISCHLSVAYQNLTRIPRYEHVVQTHSTAFCFRIMTVSWLIFSFMLNYDWRHVPRDILTDRRITGHFSLTFVQKFLDPVFYFLLQYRVSFQPL